MLKHRLWLYLQMKFLDDLGVAVEVVLHEFGVSGRAVFGQMDAECL
jgi:hypothetical protein